MNDEKGKREEAECKIKSMQKTHEKRMDRYRVALCVAIGYGILVTVCAGICTAEFQAACAQFGQMLAGTRLVWQAIFGWPTWCAEGAAMWSDNEIMSGVWYWIVVIVTWVLTGGGMLWGGGLIAIWGMYCWNNLVDVQSLTVILVAVAIGVYFAGPLCAAGINSVLMLLVTVGYLAVRGICEYRANE